MQQNEDPSARSEGHAFSCPDCGAPATLACWKVRKGIFRKGKTRETLRAVLVFALLASAQEVLTNEAIVKMVKSGLGEELVVSMVQSQPGKYSIEPDDLLKLKREGVLETVLSAC